MLNRRPPYLADLWLISVVAVLLVMIFLVVGALAAEPETYCGLVVEPENRCSPYDRRKDYHYSPWVEWDIAARAGYPAILKGEEKGALPQPFPSPYTAGVVFHHLRECDIEHIVAAAEAHDSGLCRATQDDRLAFASDLLNLTLATPYTNRILKKDGDAAEWLPEINQIWFAMTVVQVKLKYSLSVDAAERDALAGILGDWCPVYEEVEHAS